MTRGNIEVSSISTTNQVGDAGSVYIDARGDIKTKQISTASTAVNGNGANITLLSQGALTVVGAIAPFKVNGNELTFALGSFTFGGNAGNAGNAGSITIRASDDITIGSGLSKPLLGAVNASALTHAYNANAGNSGSIQLTSTDGKITVNGGMFTNSTTDNKQQAGNAGNSGDITLQASLGTIKVTPNGSGLIVTRTRSGSGNEREMNSGKVGTTGNAGSIQVTAQTLELEGTKSSLRRNLDVTTESTQTGSSGNIIFTSQTPLTLTGLTIGTDARNSNSGNVSLQAPSLTLDKTTITTTTSGTGQAGKIGITAPDGLVLLTNRSSLKTNSQLRATGNGGDINITARNLTVQEDSSLDARSVGLGKAGNIVINVLGLKNNEGLLLLNGAQISVSNQFRGQAGNIQISANRVTLDNKAKITATTANGQGGGINLNVSNLVLLRHDSEISTTAGTDKAPGNGGNINIHAPFVVTVLSENSDIIANAFSGNGGQINITANRVFGMIPQTGQSSESLRRNRTNDISASSQYGFQGSITIQSLSIDPSNGLVALPVTPIDPSDQITRGCGVTANRQNRFVVTGRGGLPPSPDDPQTSGAIAPGWVTRDSSRTSPATAAVKTPTTTATTPLVEAQGMVINSKGQIVLTAQAPTTTLHQSGLTSEFCSPIPTATN